MISFIIPTVGRASLLATLRSIETWPGDEIVLVGEQGILRSFAQIDRPLSFVHCPPGGDWGHTERNVAMPQARGQYIAHIDDDDAYSPGHRELMEEAIKEAPGRPTLFRMRFPNGITLWEEQVIRCGNVGTPMFLIPNRPTMHGTWGSFVGGDCSFLETSKWKPEQYNWRPEIIALLGHNT